MPVEVATYINQLDPLSPAGTDPKSQGDDHLRTIKSAVKQTFPNVAGAVNASHIELNHLVGVASAVQPQIDLKASKTGDSYTGIHDFSLATSVKLPAATTIGAVTAAELGYLSGVTSAIQSQFSGVSTALTGKVSRSGDAYTGNHVMTGAVVTVATQPLTDKSTKAASTKHVDDAITAAALSLSLPGQSGNAGKYLSTDGTNAGWAAAPVTSVNGRTGDVIVEWDSLPGRAPSVSNINDNTLKSDVYRVTGASTGTRPYGFSGAAVLVVESNGSAYTSQRYLDTWTSSEFRRYFSNGAWTYWSRVSLQTDSHVVANDGNLNLWRGNYFSMTVNGAATIKIDDATMAELYSGGATQYGVAIEVNLVSGSIAFANAVKWVGGSAPTFTVGKKHIIFMQREKNGPGYWLCSAQMGYAI